MEPTVHKHTVIVLQILMTEITPSKYIFIIERKSELN